jgi:iron-sulfur cluster repair protein YtfE (RIC family)
MTDDRPLALSAQLRWVHAMLRRDLATVRELATRVADGAAVPDVRADLAALETHGPLFQLRATCLGYCQLLHSHHGGEDGLLFPAVRQAAPHLEAAMDRLEADHREVATLLAEIETLARDLDRESSRHALVDVLTRLSAELLAHLAFEEETIGPVLEGWDGWPEPDADSAAASGTDLAGGPVLEEPY